MAATHESQKLEKLIKIAKPAAVKGLEKLGTAAGDKQAFLKKLMGVRARKEVDQTPDLGPTSVPSTLEKNNEVVEDEMIREETKLVEKKEEPVAESIKKSEPVRMEMEKEMEKVVEEVKKEEQKEEKEAFGAKVQKRVAEWEEELEVSEKE